MIYDSGTGTDRCWILKEEYFNSEFPEKCETVMCLGNGYMGVRSAMEDFVVERSRGTFVAGTFDFAKDDIATELPNTADVTNMKITVDGEVISPENGMTGYERTLNLRTGLLRRAFDVTLKNGKRVGLEFLRMVSLRDLHLICAKVNITAYDGGEVIIESGIDGNVLKKEHFEPIGINAVSNVLNLTTKTCQSEILFSTMTFHKFAIDGIEIDADIAVTSESELSVMAGAAFDLRAGQILTVTKTSNVFTNRDREREGCDMCALVADARAHMESNKSKSFEELLDASADEWMERVWSTRDVKIECEDPADQLAVRFAIYHLTVMAPIHDNRMSIGAKGLSGLGYRGHAFWDTEIFMMPYFIFTCPKEAASLLEYRYNSLDAARKNAKDRGYEGAMFPWEAAWITDGETTPPMYNTGLMEYHITADIASAVYCYYVATEDEAFMDRAGYELILDTAKFWNSKLEYNEKADRFEILHVIGPNEYKENVNNNAYTNYLAEYNIRLAIGYAEKLKKEKPALYKKLNGKLDLDRVYSQWISRVDRIYLPRENEDGLVPEDDTYLTLPDITRPECTLSEMAKEAHEICGDFGGLLKVMLSKQADVMLLMYLFEDLFTPEIKKKNFYFYEKRCLHDSSLSLSTYCALAADLGEKETAYRLYGRAKMIDMGNAMWSSSDGIHAASLGGIWQCSVFGFAGVRRYGEKLRIEPNLPDCWHSVETEIVWKGQRLLIKADHAKLTVCNITDTDNVAILYHGCDYPVNGELVIDLK